MITGAVDVTLTTEQGVSILLQVVDSRDGMYRVEFKAIVVSTYIMNVTVASQLIPTSLYRVRFSQLTTQVKFTSLTATTWWSPVSVLTITFTLLTTRHLAVIKPVRVCFPSL